MSEQEQAQERTEQPTPKRLQKAREKGQVPRSRELNTMAVMLAGAATMLMLGDSIMSGLRELLVQSMYRPDPELLLLADPAAELARSLLGAVWLLSPLFGILLVAALAGPALLGGLLFSAEAARPKLERLSVPKGLKRIFSRQGLMELVKTLLKFSVLTGAAAAMLWWFSEELISLGRIDPEQGMLITAGKVRLAFVLLCFGLLLIAAVDVPFQLANHFRQLRMTRQEIKDEHKESEGSPELRARIRRTQQEIAGRRMMDEVGRADVVVTNPTHFAVALRYTDRPDRAPRVVAKGRDLVAGRIRELAAEHGVPVCSAPMLARAIYYNTALGEEIPASLYLAVARLLAWVMQIRAPGQAVTPPPTPADLPVPPGLDEPRRAHR